MLESIQAGRAYLLQTHDQKKFFSLLKEKISSLFTIILCSPNNKSHFTKEEFESVRDILLYKYSNNHLYLVFITDADTLSPLLQSSLLLILEKLDNNLTVILSVSSSALIIPTIQSRTIRLYDDTVALNKEIEKVSPWRLNINQISPYLSNKIVSIHDQLQWTEATCIALLKNKKNLIKYIKIIKRSPIPHRSISLFRILHTLHALLINKNFL